MHRLATSARPPLLVIADRAGRVAGWFRRSVVIRSVPGAAGAVAVAYGLGEVYRPLWWVTLGVFALLVDRRIPS